MLGVRFKNRREELGMSLHDVSRITGMPTKYVSALEHDQLQEFVSSSREIERLTQLYARKLNIPMDSGLISQLSKSKSADQIPSSDVAIPLFLLVSSQDKKIISESPK